MAATEAERETGKREKERRERERGVMDKEEERDSAPKTLGLHEKAQKKRVWILSALALGAFAFVLDCAAALLPGRSLGSA